MKVWDTELTPDDHKYRNVDCVEGKQRLKEIEESKPAIDHIMKPGDLVYVPAHKYHQYTFSFTLYNKIMVVIKVYTKTAIIVM